MVTKTGEHITMNDFEQALLKEFFGSSSISHLDHAEEVYSHDGESVDFSKMSDTELLKAISDRARELAKQNGLSVPADEFFEKVGKIFRKVREEHR
jgi:hypothetical protein